MGVAGGGRWWQPGAPGSQVSRVELLYDLVFVFAFLNVTTLASQRLNGEAVVQAGLVLALLWWCWIGFAATCNVVRPDRGAAPAVGFVVILAVFVLALTTGEAFTPSPDGVDGPVVFAGAYLITWAFKIAVMWGSMQAGRRAHLRSAVLAAPTITGGLLILAAATLPRRLFDPPTAERVQMGLWIAAIVSEYAVGLLLVRTGWRLRSVGHWAERHSLIVLVALGEAVIALGLGVTTNRVRPLTWSVLTAAACGVAVIAALWWLYFDRLAAAVEQRLHGVRTHHRLALARDAYTYLHLPLVAGIIGFALGLKHLLTHPDAGGLTLPLLYGGVALYLATLVAIEARALHRLNTPLLAAAALTGVAVPILGRTRILTTLALLAAGSALLVAAVAVTTAGERRRVRDLTADEQHAAEAETSHWRRQHL